MKKSLLAIVLFFLYLITPFSVISSAPVYTIQTFSDNQYPILIQPIQNILFEDFTATWCGWCHFSYEIFDQLFLEYGDRILHIRYHNQDTIAMPDIKERRDFYKVTGYPTMVFNGNNKIIGADQTTYPTVKKLVDELFLQTPSIGMNSFGVINGQSLQMTLIMQSYLNVPITGQLMTVFTESQVIEEEKSFNFVSRYAFPSFKGISLTMEPHTIYLIKFSQPIQDISKANQFQAVSFFQDFPSTRIYNSCLYSFGSLSILKSSPITFEQGVKRDLSFEIQFQEGLILSSIQDSLFLLIDQDEKMHEIEWEYDSAKRILHFYPKELLNKNTGFSFWIIGGKNSLTGVSKRFLRTNFILPFFTSEIPELSIQLSEWQVDLGEVWPIDKPEILLTLEEKNGNPVRVKISSKVSWITINEPIFIASKKIITIHIHPDMMQIGLNMSTLLIATQTGNIYVPIQGTLFKPDYPLIRFGKIPFIIPNRSIKVNGKTDGYRVFLNKQELNVDLEGNFSVMLNVKSGLNIFNFQSMNMQRKIGTFPLMIFGIGP